jgi:hypothetical protein
VVSGLGEEDAEVCLSSAKIASLAMEDVVVRLGREAERCDKCQKGRTCFSPWGGVWDWWRIAGATAFGLPVVRHVLYQLAFLPCWERFWAARMTIRAGGFERLPAELPC